MNSRFPDFWETDISKHEIPLFEIKIVIPKRDKIPPIDNPEFWNIKQADEHFTDNEPVISLAINDEAKAYPLSILTFHEVVNDQIGEKKVSVTYCPLCNASITFNRTVEHSGKEKNLDFGVSGMLRNSDLIMWDRQTESWWQQFSGKAIVGKMLGAELEMLPSMVISYEEFKKNHPNGKVLSTNTGASREYGKNPYAGYDDTTKEGLMFPVDYPDMKMPAKERLVNVDANGKSIV
ncbi:MAG: DUF3179 domain-containing protein, partial [Flavobacteriales bacterium]